MKIRLTLLMLRQVTLIAGFLGCTQALTAQCTANITSNAGTTITCINPCINLTSSGSSGTTLSWTTQQCVAPGTYEVTATTANGCTAVSSITISLDGTPPLAGLSTSVSQLTCAITSATLSATPTGMAYTWSAGALAVSGTNTATIASAGTYMVTATAANGCTSSSSIVTTQNATPPSVVISATPCAQLSPNSTITLTASLLSGSNPATYSWAGGVLAVTTAGTYTVTAIASNGCSSTASIVVTQSTVTSDFNIATVGAACLPDSSDNSSCAQVCNHALATYEVVEVGSEAEVTWAVNGAESFASNGNQVTVQWGDAGQGLVSASVVNNEYVPPLQVWSLFNESGQSLTINIFGGISPYIISLINENGSLLYDSLVIEAGTCNFSYPQYNFLNTGVIHVNITDASGQSYTGFEYTGGGGGILVNSIVQPTDCNTANGSIGLAWGGYDSFVWSNGDTTEDISGLAPGIYTVSAFFGTAFHVATVIISCPETSACPAYTQLCVQVLEDVQAIAGSIPAADANGNIEICQGQTVFFKNLSVAAANYLWDFGDLNTSTAFEPSHTYPSAGSFTVRLIARNACYCADTTYLTVTVLPAFKPDISCSGTLCEGETAMYSTSVACGTYSWVVSSGGTVVSGGSSNDNFVEVQWHTGPEGTVSLLATGCAGVVCNQPNVIVIPILTDATEISGEVKPCPGSTESYSVPDFQGTGFSWSVSAAGTIIDGQGTHQITIRWQDDLVSAAQWVAVNFDNCYLKCGGQDTLPVFLKSKFYIEGPVVACFGATVPYQNIATLGGVATSFWAVTDSLGVQVWASSGAVSTANIPWNFPMGLYAVRAVPSALANFCIDDYTIFVRQLPAPPSVGGIIGATPICIGEPYTYNAISLPQYEVQWTIQNGTSGATFGNPINVTWGSGSPRRISAAHVSLDGLGCLSDTVTLQVGLIPSNFAMSGTPTSCRDATGTYTAANYPEARYEWTIVPANAGTIVSGEGSNSIQVLWHQPGAATVRATLCGNTVTQAVTVFALPEPFVPDFAACPNTSIPVSGGVWSSYAWMNESAIQVSTSATAMLTPGYYELIVTDANGCAGDTTFHIEPLPIPNASISAPIYLGLCPNGPMADIYVTTTEDGYTYQWYDSGNLMTETGSIFSTNHPGTYYAIATNTFGCSAPTNTLNLVDCETAGGICVGGICMAAPCSGSPTPSCVDGGFVDFAINPTADCSTHQYQNTSLNGVSGSYAWLIGNMVFSNQNSPTYTFSKPGFYVITLIGDVVNANDPNASCPDGVFYQDVIQAVADFKSTIACAGLPTAFTDLTEYLPQYSITAWSWNFGDPASGANNTSTAQNPGHIYGNAGTYSVMFTATMSSGCQTTVTKTVTVEGVPTANFVQPNTSCEDTPLPFQGTPSANATSFYWYFDDPASGTANVSSTIDAYHAFAGAGSYDVSLTVRNIYGCEAIHTEAISVTPNILSGQIGATPPSPLCEGETSTLTAPNGADTWSWSTVETTPSIIVAQSGVYQVTLTTTEGCTYTTPDYIMNVWANPTGQIQAIEYNEYNQPVAYFSGSYSACEEDEVYLQALTTPANCSVVWSDGSIGSEISFTSEKGNLLGIGTHTFSATITDNITGCTNGTTTFTVTINPAPVVAIASSPLGFLCENTNATLSVITPQGGNTYYWNTGEAGTSIQTALGGQYFCRTINAFGCIGESNIIEIHNAPDAAAVPDGCLVRCQPDTMCIPINNDVISYQWFQDGAPMPAPNGTQANAVFVDDGTYQLQMVDIYGCTTLSDTLSLDLYIGYGDISGLVYADVNQNGMIDAPDTLVSNVALILNDGAGTVTTVSTTINGNYLFNDVFAVGYTLSLDTAALNEQWEPIWITAPATLIGCDDTTAVVWLLHPACVPDTNELSLQICLEDSTQFNGQWLHVGDIATSSLTNAEGCDSLVQLQVSALPHLVLTLNETSCNGVPFDYLGTPIMPDGIQVMLTSINTGGCLDTTFVTVNAIPTDSINLQLSICNGETITYNGHPFAAGEEETFVFTNMFGCDSTVVVSVVQSPQPTLAAIVDSSCYNATNGQIALQVTGTTPPYSFSLNGSATQTSPIFTDLAPDTYILLMTDANNCTISDTLEVGAIPPVTLGSTARTIVCGDTIQLIPEVIGGFAIWVWADGSIAPAPLLVTEPGIYGFTLMSQCDTTQQAFAVTLDATDPTALCFVPNTFTPNGDYENDCFMPYFRPDVVVVSYKMQVFDRWGALIFRTTEPTACWDGSYRNKMLDSGVFVWVIEAVATGCNSQLETYLFKGNVTIIK